MAHAPKKLAIIDGKSVFYRGYYAMPNLSTKDGTPTGGVFGFATMALEVLRKLKPDYVCVAWDKPKTNIRKRLEMYPQYKAGRKPAPTDFYEQIPVLHELLDAFGWPLYELDDYEADDIMGTFAVQATAQGVETMLVTSDLDVLQLVHPLVHVYALKKGLSNIELFKPESFEAKYGIQAEQFLDLKALKGDSSDNIPGVPGIGEKTAIELLKTYKTLDNIYENTALIKETTSKKLIAGKDLAYLSKKLGAIWTDAPIKLDLEAMDGTRCNPENIKTILQKLEFRSLVRQLPEVMRVAPSEVVVSDLPATLGQARLPAVPGQADKFSGSGSVNYVMVSSPEELAKIDTSSSKQLVIHGYCSDKQGLNALVLLVSPTPQTVYVLDLPKLRGDALNRFLASIRQVPMVGYDLKSTFKIFLAAGLALPVVDHDLLLGAFLINSLRREQNLTELAAADINYDGPSIEDFAPEDLMIHAGEVSSIIWGLYKNQTAELHKEPKLSKVAKDIDWPIIPVLTSMEFEGIQLDADYLVNFADQLRDIISDIEQQIYGFADQEFNIASPHQLAEILYEKLSLPTTGVKKGKTGYSTAANELDKLRASHPIIDQITRYREATKLMNTYVETLPKMVDAKSRLHTTFNLTIAQTGRLSSTDPNLQNIPVRSDLGKHIRTAFVAGPGNVLIGADYSQFELRLAAILCKDDNLIDQFNQDKDVHTATAAQIYGREPEDVTKNMRRDAKVVNFGVMYGLGPHGLTVATGMTYEAAKKFIEKYFQVRPKLQAYIESVKEEARKEGYTETYFGRRRPTPDVHSSNFAVREAAIRAAVNMPFQGTAADIMKLAMIEVDKKLQGTKCKMLLQIHDSILVECPEEEAEPTANLIKETMENVHKLPVKLTVDTVIGKNWGEL